MSFINLLHKPIYYLGVKYRNPSYYKALDSLMESDTYTLDKLKALQFDKLKKLLIHADKNSCFYKESFTKANFKPERDFNSLTDISKIPVLEKSDLLKYKEQIHTIQNYKFKKLFASETSGSSGEALVFFKDETWDSYNRASIARGMSWHKVNVWDKNGYFWGYSFSFFGRVKTFILDFLMNRFRIFSYSEDSINQFVMKAKKAKYLSGYSSMIYEVAKIVNKKQLVLSNIKFVKGTSEKIYDHYQPEVLKAFGTRIVSEYGAAEAGIIAFECPEQSMHINEETCYVEVEHGEILVTNLVAYSFPVIRYKLGDYVKLSNHECSCGRKHRVIAEVQGRVGKNIVGFNSKLFPSLTLYYIFKRMAVEHSISLNYKAEQHEVGKLIVYVRESLDDTISSLIHQIAYSYFGDSVTLVIAGNHIIHNKNKKLKDFESFLN